MAEVIDSTVTLRLTIDEAKFLGHLLGQLSPASVENLGCDKAMFEHLFRFFNESGFNWEGRD